MNPTYERDESERDIFAAMASGDQSAFERLYRLYEKRVYQYVYTLVNDQTMAEDIVEETMIAIWRGARTFSGASRVSTWIFGIARHKSLDAIRQTSRRMRELDLEAAAELPTQTGTPMDDAQRRQQETIMAQAMSTLSREHQ